MDETTKEFLVRIVDHMKEIDEHMKAIGYSNLRSDTLRNELEKLSEDIWYQETAE